MLQKILQSNNTCKWRMNSTLSEKNQSYTVWHRANWHISECNFVLRCKFRGQSLHAEEEITSCHFKTSSVTMDQWIMWCVHGQQTAVSHIGHPMDRTVTIPHGSGLLPTGIFWKTVYTGIAHTHTHTHNTRAEPCYSGWDCNHISRAVTQILFTVFKLFTMYCKWRRQNQ